MFINNQGGTIENSVFRNNRASTVSNKGYKRGGAIYAASISKSDMNTSIINCLFYNNTALDAGSAIYLEADETQMNRGGNIINCTFHNNKHSKKLSASVELVNSGMAVNNIICNNNGLGFKSHFKNQYYIAANIISKGNGLTTSQEIYPGPILEIESEDIIEFVNPTIFQGAVFPGESDYEERIAEIRKANYNININNSILLDYTNSLNNLPEKYHTKFNNKEFIINTEIPSYDIIGKPRIISNITPGAYQAEYPPIMNLDSYKKDSYVIYPTIVRDYLNIEAIGSYKVTIYDMFGRKRFYSKNENNSIIDMSNFHMGSYIIELNSEQSKSKFNILKK